MSRYYKLPVLSEVAWFIADHLPNKVRAVLFIQAYMSLDEHYKSVTTAKDKSGSYSMFSAVDGVRIESLRREAFIEGLKAKVVERHTPQPTTLKEDK